MPVFSPCPPSTRSRAGVRMGSLLSPGTGTGRSEAGGERGRQAVRRTDTSVVGPPHLGDTRAPRGISGDTPCQPGHPCECPSRKGSSGAPHPQGPASQLSVNSVSWGAGGARRGGDKILPDSLKSFGIFTQAHVIFKLLPLSTPSCLPWLPQVNL